MNKTEPVLKAFKRGRKLVVRQVAEIANANNGYDIIHKLRKAGHNIVTTEKRKAGRMWAVYSLEAA